jgi:hypothetical protein
MGERTAGGFLSGPGEARGGSLVTGPVGAASLR